MIKLENVVLASPEQMEFIIEGMRNPMNSWEKSDSEKEFTNAKWPEEMFILGENDHSLMQRLSNAGTEHRKYMRMMSVYVRITAPLYWWKEFDTYKVGTVANSCSTMHKIAEKEFTLDDFSCEHLGVFIPAEKNDGIENYQNLWIATLEEIIDSLNVARTLYNRETDPKLKKNYWWQMILPYSELITVKKKPFSVLSPMLEPGYMYAQNECINPDVDQISEYLKTLWLRR